MDFFPIKNLFPSSTGSFLITKELLTEMRKRKFQSLLALKKVSFEYRNAKSKRAAWSLLKEIKVKTSRIGFLDYFVR